jgi:predicted RNA-binding protein YlxR (DUF448 family)
MATKHVPIRTCIATGQKKPKNEMIRLLKMPDGSVTVDIKGREKGRGANLTMDITSFDLAVKKNAISRALKLERKLSTEEISKLREEFLNAIDEKSFRSGSKSVTLKISRDQLKSLADSIIIDNSADPASGNSDPQ